MKKTNKLISILLVLAMLLSMAPLTVLAADGHTHALSADGETVEFAELPADTTKITAAGSYYLTQDIELTSEFWIEVEGTVNLCLNGHSITATADNSNDVVIFIESGTLNLCDCQGGGCITSAEDLSFSGVTVWSGAVFNMYGGEIKDNAYYAVKGANFNMYGGKLSGNKKSAVYVTNTFNMYGGEISGNVKSDIGGVAVEVNSGNFNMYGGEIKNNENISSHKNASIVGVNDGATFTMNGGKICDNTGTAVYCDGSFIMNSGEISGNDDDYVAGVCVNTGYFNMNGGEIKNNKGNYAGGIYIENNGGLNIKAGKIIGNSASIGNRSDSGGGIGFLTGSVVLSGADIQIKDNVNTETSSSSNQNVARNVVFKVAAPLDPAKTQIAFDLKEAVFARPDGTNLTTLSGMEKCFISPSEELFVVCNEDGELETTYWSSSIKEKDGDFVVTVSADSGVTYQWYQADVEELKMLVGETSNKLTNDKLVVGKTYFCKIYYNGQEIETLTIGYPYEITHQPTEAEPYVELNDDTDATYQWNTVEGGNVEVTDDGEIGYYYDDSYYDEDTGWNGDWWSDYGADYFYVYLEEGQKITIIPSAYCEEICIRDYDTDEYGKDAECEADEGFTYIAEVDGWYYVYAYTDYYDYTTLRAYIGDADYTEIEGETAAELKNAEFGKMYACEVTFADGTTEMSDVIDLSYKITHQPTAGEPYVELNDDTDASYQWNTVEGGEVEVTNANAETVSYDWGESSYDKETGWTGVPYEEDYYGQDFFTVELEAGETITVEVTGDFANGVGIWDYDTENDDWANAEEDVTSYELTAESAGNYTFYTYVNSGVVTVKAYKNSIDYTEIEGETAAELKNAEFGKMYACKVTFADGTTEMSDSFKYTYAITHQPTVKEPYVELNDDTDAAYQWNTVELAEEITSENAADETGYYGEEFVYSAITGWEGIPYDSYGGYDYFAVELEEDETITVVVNGEFDDDIGIWDYYGDDGVYCYSNSENVYTFTAPYTATYWLYIDGANDDVTVKAYYGHGNTYTKIEGETAAELKNAEFGKMYACEVTFADGTTEMSDVFENIELPDPVVAAPTANTLTYNGSAQELITAGSANGGEMQYSLDGEAYSADIPTATNAGEYTVYYKVVGDANHDDTEPEEVTVTIDKKSVSVSATVPDRIYGEHYEVDTSKVVVTFDGIVDGDDVGYVVTDATYYMHTVTENAPVQVDYNVNGADADNYQFPEFGEYLAPNYGVQATGRVLPRDISDAVIVLGDALVYNGAEQTQTVAAVTVIGKDVTYDVNGNKATNVGVYELTVTGNGNFAGTKTALYEIAPDTATIDDLTVDNVKSSDKEAIEAVAQQIENAVTDLADDETKAEYKAIADKCDELLKKIDENENQAGKDETAEKAVAEIGEELEMFDENRVTKFWEDDIEALKAKIDELLADENMGETEKAKLNEYKAQAEKLIEIINTPKEYFSLRFFYLIWDCLTWKYNGILWIFSKIFG